MKRLLFLFAITICFAILFYPETTIGKLTGSPGGETGSPTDNSSCTSCHNAGAGTGATITTNIPTNGYIPGNIYTITADVTQSGINTFGFEITAEEANLGSAKTGTFFVTNSSETKLVNSNTAITHKAAGTSGTNGRSWSMDWEAPSAGTGAITFYGAYIGANGNGNNSGDTYHSTTLTFNEGIPGCTDSTATNYDATATVDDGSCIICNKNVTQALIGFDPDPVYGPWVWSYDTLTLTNTSSCDVRVRPEFDISHDSFPIGLTDFDLKWYNPYISAWAFIPYTIEGNGHAVGIWGVGGDTTGIITNPGTTQQVIIRVRFKPSANYGSYSALWRTNEVDSIGNFIQNLDLDSTHIDYVDCSAFGVDSSNYSDITCNGANDGNASILTMQNGSGNYSYNWNNGGTTNEINNLTPGNYYCIITDLNWQQCSDSIGFSIAEPSILTATTSSTAEGCIPGGNGTATVIPSGGTGPYTYLWNDFATQVTQTAASLIAGTYNVNITDANACVITATEVVLSAPILDLTYTTSANPIVHPYDISCFGASDGSISTSINSGTLPVSYLWEDITNPGVTLSTDSAISSLAAGVYTLAASDSNGCAIYDTITLTEPDLVTTGLVVTNPTCVGDNDGQASINPGGVDIGDWYVLWNSIYHYHDTTISLGVGTHTVEIINTITGGCSSGIETFTITDPAELTSSYTQTNVSCNGANDGSAIVTFFGGTIGDTIGDTNYILGWAGTPVPVYLPYPQNVFNTTLLPPPYNAIPPGIYPYTVTDLNGCTIYDTITITEPDSLAVSLTADTICCYGNNDGVAVATVTGGIASYTYLWSPSGQTTSVATGLSAGIHICTVTDANGCTIQDSIIVYEYALMSTSLTATNPLCFGDSNGSIYANGIGGDGNYTYLWEDITNPGITLSTDSAISSLEAGTYSCYVTDGCGCTFIDTYTLTEPNEISLNIDSLTDITIYGGSDGSIYISSTGGSGLLSTSWTSDNGFSSNNEDITNLLSGFYYIEITDSNSCTYLDTIELTEPSSLWMNLDLATNASCFDSCNGALNITANGGDSTYTYTWTGPNGFTSTNDDLTNLCDGAYIITVDDGITTLTDTFNVYQPQAITSNLLVDSIMCHNDVAQAEINVWGGTQPLIYNWSNGGNSYITTVSSGAHSINVTDQNGCSISHSFSLTNPDSIISTTTSTSINCSGGNDGSASISIISGGAPPYAYLWSNGQTTNIATGLSAGTYSCTITDANGCLDSASVDVVEPDEIISITSSIDASCYNYCDGSVSVTTTGGIPPYSYVWTNGQSTQTATGLCAGSYNVTITDDNSCSVIHSAIVNEPNPLLINIWINGSDLVATNGFSTYQWYTASGTLIPGATSEIFNPSSMGEYYVSVTDSNGCSENSLIIDYNISGLNSLDQSIKIYPNPTNGFLTIEGTHAINSITVMTSIGNQLLKVENNNNEVSSTKLDLSTFAKGIYFIQIEQNNQIVNYRIVLQ